MRESFLRGKRILVVDNEADFLAVLEKRIRGTCSSCQLDKATNYPEAVERMTSSTYDLVLLGGVGVQTFDLLRSAVGLQLPVIMVPPPFFPWEDGLRKSLGGKPSMFLESGDKPRNVEP